jgi:putative phosphoesterase
MEAYQSFNAYNKLKAVFGNADVTEIKRLLPKRVIFEVEGLKIGLVHEGGLSLNDTTAQNYLAKEMDVDLLIFGHLHRPLIEKNDSILICPGSPTEPRMSSPSVVELTIENKNINVRIITLEGDFCKYMKFLNPRKNH